jgi:hypothetical protein
MRSKSASSCSSGTFPRMQAAAIRQPLPPWPANVVDLDLACHVRELAHGVHADHTR